MTTKLTAPLKREIDIDGDAYTVLLTKTGVRLTRKRFRQGPELSWRALLEMGEHEKDEVSG